MSGVTCVFAGDFRQTLPVIEIGTRADIIEACLKSSVLKSSVQILKLWTNIRAFLDGSDNDFPKQLNLGDGKLLKAGFNNNQALIVIDNKLGHILHNNNELIVKIYPDIECLLQKDFYWLCSGAIVSPKMIRLNK